MRFFALLVLAGLCSQGAAQEAALPFPRHLDAGWRATLAGRFDEARAEYAACLAWSPRNATVAFHLACLERDAGAPDVAATWLARAAEWGYADAAFARHEFGEIVACAAALALFDEPSAGDRGALAVRWTAGTRAPLLAPDGLRVVCSDGALWDLDAGVPIAVFAGAGRWGGARFGEDGSRLMTWTRPGELTLRDGFTGRRLARVWPDFALDPGESNDYAHVSVRADLGLAFVARGNRPGHLIDVARGAVTHSVTPRGGRVQRALLADEHPRLLLVAGETFSVLDTETGRETLISTDAGRGSHTLVARGRFAACVAQGARRLTVVDLANDAELGRIEGVGSACIHPDEPVLVAWHPAGRLAWYELPSLDLVREQAAPDDYPYVLTFDPTGRQLIVSQRTEGVRAYEAFGGEPRLIAELLAGWGSSVSYDASGALLAAESGGGTHVLDAATGALLQSIESLDVGRPVALAGQAVGAVGRAHGDVALFDLSDGATVGVLAGTGTRVRALESDHAFRRLLAQDEASVVSVYDIERRALIMRFAGARSARLARDGEVVYTFGDEQGLRVFDVASGELLAQLAAGEIVERAVWDPAGGVAVTRDEARRAHVWDVEDGVEVCAPLVLPEGVSSIALDPSLRFVALGTRGPQLFVHEVPSGVQVARLEAVGSFPFGVETRHLAFSPDGAALVGTTGDAGTVQCWSTDGWTRRWAIDNGGGNASSIGLEFTRDGRRLCTAGMGVERVIDARTGETLVDLGRRGVRTLHASATRVLASEFGGAAVVFDGERALYRRAEVAGGALLVHPSGFLGGEPGALREAFVASVGVGEPADGFAPLLFDPRRATADPALVGTPTLPDLPVLDYAEDTGRFMTRAGDAARLAVHARGADLVGVHVTLDGVRLSPDEVEWTASGVALVTIERGPEDAPRRLVFRARDARGLLSVPLRTTLRFSDER